MNSLIETLNDRGAGFLTFAWLMLWQSSLLIGVLLAFDWLGRRRVRASVRYMLWLVVLVKLCLPPTLALPTSPAWWWHQMPPPVAAKPPIHYAVTYDNTPRPELPATPAPVFAPPKPAMTGAGWCLLGSAAVSAGLLGWLLVRWGQITRLVRRAETCGRLTALAVEAQPVAGMKFKVPVKLTMNAMSPAVCGLFRPAILIPRALAEQFSDEQLRAVLLHELIHLRRRDVWLNFGQALVQIAYWWHPLVWVANARIRRVREEAVDDAVMLALRDGAEEYAPTLLEVAKLALNRPLASLGLVGIMESRNALRQRIERLLDFHPPRRAGLTLVSLLGVLAFTAVAVPMGQGPVAQQKVEAVEPAVAPAVIKPSAVLQKANIPEVLVTAHFFYTMRPKFYRDEPPVMFNLDGTGGSSWALLTAGQFGRFHNRLNETAIQQFSAPRAVTISGQEVSMFIGNGTNNTMLDCTPVVTNGQVSLMVNFSVVAPQAGVLVTNQFRTEARVEDRGGILVVPGEAAETGQSNVVALVGVEIITNAATRFQQRLQTVIKRAGDTNTDASGLMTRTYRVDTRTFIASLRRSGAELGDKTNSPAAISAAVRQFFAGLGVDLGSPAGKAVFFNDGNGMLFVKATAADQNIIDHAIEALTQVAPQIHIKARFLQVPNGTVAGLGNLLNATNVTATEFTGVLKDADLRTLLHALKSLKGSVDLGEPEVTTLSGRQCQMRATEVITVVSNFLFQAGTSNGTSAVSPQLEQCETGPILDVVPYVLADGYTINLALIPSVTEFLGYDAPPNVPNLTGTNNEVQLPVILPRFSVRQMTANLNLRDNQTMVLGGMSEIRSSSTKSPVPVLGSIPLMGRLFQGQHEQTSTNELLVLVTATIVDPAGNRLHNDEELSRLPISAAPDAMGGSRQF